MLKVKNEITLCTGADPRHGLGWPWPLPSINQSNFICMVLFILKKPKKTECRL